MSLRHLMTIDTIHGAIPLCGQAMWEGLTSDPNRNECWECASIAGAYSPELQTRFNVNADGTERHTIGVTIGRPFWANNRRAVITDARVLVTYDNGEHVWYDQAELADILDITITPKGGDHADATSP